MDELEVSDEESENPLQEGNESDCGSSVSEKEAHLYSLIYHEDHTELQRIRENIEKASVTEENSRFHVSERSKAFRLNRVNAVTDTPPALCSMPDSKAIRNQIRKVTAKLDAMKQKCTKEIDKHTNSKNSFSKKSLSNKKINRHWSGSSIPSFCVPKLPEAKSDNINSNDDVCQVVLTGKDSGKNVIDKARLEISNDHTVVEKEIEISKYDLALNKKTNLDTSECVIILDSDAESVDSIIEVKPPTPPTPVVIHIDSSDESSQTKENKRNDQKENIDPCPPSDHIEIDIASENTEQVDRTQSKAPSENNLVVSYAVAGMKSTSINQDTLPTYQNISTVDTTGRTKKRKRNRDGTKTRRLKTANKVLSQSVPLSWTSEMIQFYCHNSGGREFDHEKLQRQMKGNASNWKVLDVDLLGPLPRYGPFSRSRCLNCNQLGHILQQCPDPLREISCCMCGAKGHTKHTCPNKICLQCGRRANTFSKGCEKCCYDTQNCATCGQSGHYMWLCPEAWRKYHSSTSAQEIPCGSTYSLKTPSNQFCCNCARRGHTSLTCKSPTYEAFDCHGARSRSRGFMGLKYKKYKNMGYDKFSTPNINRKLKKNKRNCNLTVVKNSEPLSRKKKKFNNTERKRIKKKQKKVLQNKMANTQQK